MRLLTRKADLFEGNDNRASLFEWGIIPDALFTFNLKLYLKVMMVGSEIDYITTVKIDTCCGHNTGNIP